MGAGASELKENVHGARAVTPRELVLSVNTGDLIFFVGNSWTATLERWLTWCDYSHVGMVVWRILPGELTPTACLWESTGHIDELPCLLQRRRKPGVRLVPLEAKIATYMRGNTWHETRVATIDLRENAMKPDARPEFEARLAAFIDEACGMSYQTGFVDTMRGAYASVLGPASMDPTFGYTCNQLVVASLLRMHAYGPRLPVGRISIRALLEGYVLNAWSDLAVLDHLNHHFIVRPTAGAYAPV